MTPSMEGFEAMLRKMLQKENIEYEVIAQLTTDQKKEWDEVQKLLADAESMIGEAKARKDLFWIRIRKLLGQNDREHLKIEDGLLWGNKDVPKELPAVFPPKLEDEN